MSIENTTGIYRETTDRDGNVSREQVGELPTEHFVDYTTKTDRSKLWRLGLTRLNTYPLQRAYIDGEAEPEVVTRWREGRRVINASIPVRDGEARLPRADGSHLIFKVDPIIQQGRINSERANARLQSSNVNTVWAGNSMQSTKGKNGL